MNKSFSRDIQTLTYIRRNQQKIRDAVSRFGCDLSTAGPKSILRDEQAFDLCAMYMAQIGENVKLLTDASKEDLNEIINIKTLTYFRNMIDHSYEKVNKSVLLPYIKMAQSDKALQQVEELIKECFRKKNSSN